MLVVAVEDDGRGFNLARAMATGNGLANLTERMHDIGGVCRITTAPGSGCRVEFELPLTRFARRAGPPDGGAGLLANGLQLPETGHASPEEAHAS
jgi:signal transduction histidine kinase